MFLSMNNNNYMSNSNRFKDIGTFLSKKSLMRSHVTRNSLDDPKSSATGYGGWPYQGKLPK